MKHRLVLPLRLALCLGSALAGCRSAGDDSLVGGERRRAVAIEARDLARPGELEKALSLPHRELVARLGPHRLAATTSFTLEAGAAKESFDERFLLEVDPGGPLRALREDGHGGGFEWIVAGGRLHVRPRYGRFVHRKPEGDEVERVRDQIAGLLGGYFAVLGRFMARRLEGSEPVAGRPALKLRLARADTAAPLRDPDPAHAWRATIEPISLDGTVWIDAATGAPLQARLEAAYRCSRDGKPITARLRFESALSGFGAMAAIAAPDESDPPPIRPRPLVDRQLLLDGLAAEHGAKRLDDDL